MMRWFLTLALAALWFSGAAHAGTLTSATWVGDFQGTPFTLVTSGASLTASGSASGSAIGSVFLSVAAPPLTQFQDSFPGIFISQTLGGSQTIGSANMANQGISGRVRTFVGVDNTGGLGFSIPLSAGVAGNSTTAYIAVLGIPVEVTATFFPWATGFQTVTGLTRLGLPVADVTLSGTHSLVGGIGRITLVSPTRTRICEGTIFGSFPCVPADGARTTATATSLTLNFAVPEPGTVLLLGACLVGLAARDQRNRRFGMHGFPDAGVL